MARVVLLFALCNVATGPAAMALSPGDRFLPCLQASQRVEGELGRRLTLHAEELARQLRRASAEGSEQLGTLVEAAALICRATDCGPVREALPGAVHALIRQSERWGDVAAFRRGLWGLLGYYEATGDRGALEAARRAGDAASGKVSVWRDLVLGLAPLAGPAARLFAYTGERRRLTQGITPEMEGDGAPRLLRALWVRGSLEGAERAGADDILSTLAGLVELYRLTGQAAFLRGAEKGWDQVVRRHLYVTGAVSARNRLRGDGALPGEPSASVGEPGATAEWVRLNLELLRATGETRYADEIERTLYNHLLALQDEKTGVWAASAPLIGRRKYEAAGSGRGAGAALALSLASTAFLGTLNGSPAVVVYVRGRAVLSPKAGSSETRVKLALDTDYPESGAAVLRIGDGGAGRYAIHLRVPSWCPRYTAAVAGQIWSGSAGQWLRVDREWREGEEVRIRMEMAVRTRDGGTAYPGQVALQRGPVVLALDASANPGLRHLHRVAVDPTAVQGLALPVGRKAEGTGRKAYSVAGTAVSWAGGRAVAARTKLMLVPFSEAREYRVWLPMADRLPVGPMALTAFAEESWSGDAVADGSICDERTDTFRTASSDGKDGSWFAVELERPEWIDRVVYRHGRIMVDGGWFDSSQGKPLVQIRRSKEGPWETVGRLENYPLTNGKAPPPLFDGQAFELRLPEPAMIVAVRVLGQPGGRFSSCAELAAYGPTREARDVWASRGKRPWPIRLAETKP